MKLKFNFLIFFLGFTVNLQAQQNLFRSTNTNLLATGVQVPVSGNSALLIPKGNYAAITTSGNFPFNPALGGGNVSFIGGATYSGSTTWGPHQLFNNTRTDTDWCNNGGGNHFGQFTFPKSVTITKIFIVPRTQGDNFPTSVTLKVDDVTIGIYTTKSISSVDGLQINYSGIGHFIVPNLSGTKWRLEFSGNDVYIGELEFIGF
jgi:hypothetical protein